MSQARGNSKQKIYNVYLKQHRKVMLLSYAALSLTVVLCFILFKNIATVWSSTSIGIIVGVSLLFHWWANSNGHVKDSRKASVFSSKEQAIKDVLKQEPGMELVIIKDGLAGIAGLNQKVLFFSEKFLSAISTEQAIAVTYHEIGHIKNNDLAISVICSTLLASLKGIRNVSAVYFLGHLIFGSREIADTYYISFLLTSLGILLTSLLENYVSRQREYAADAFAVVQGYGIELAQALRAICVLEKREQLLKRPNLVVKIIYLFHSHPPMASRISAIENISQGSEGIVKDRLEKNFTAVVLVILWTVGLFFLKPTTIWSIGTVPLLYVTGPLFLFLIYLMLTSPTGVHNPMLFELEQKKGKEQTDIAFAIAALLFIAAFVVTGALSLIWSAILLGLSWIVPVGLLTAMVGLTFQSNTVAKRTMYSLAMLSAAIIVIVSLTKLLIG